MVEKMPKRTLKENVQNVQDAVRARYEDLELKEFQEIDSVYGDGKRERTKEMERRLGEVVTILSEIPFDNPAQKEAFIAQVVEMFQVLSSQTDQIRELDETHYREAERLRAGLIADIDAVLGVVDLMSTVGQRVAPPTDSQEVVVLRRDDERERRLGDILRGAKVAVVQFEPDPSLRARAKRVIGPLFGAEVAASIVDDGAAFLMKGPDGNMYLARKSPDNSGYQIIQGLPPMPVLDGMKIITRRLKLPKEQTKVTANFEADSAEEKRTRVDQMVDDAFVDTATIIYTQRSIDKYKKYPAFQYSAGQEVPLVRGRDRRFYFANETGEPRTDVPRAFVFAGDSLSYERSIDTVDQMEGAMLMEQMGDHLDAMFRVKEKADQIGQKYGVEIKYSREDADWLEKHYMDTTPGLKHIDVEMKPQYELMADLETIEELYEDYGPAWMGDNDLKQIWLVGGITTTDKDNITAVTKGVDLGKGRMVINNIASLDHEIFHVSEGATVGEGAVAGNDWLIGAEPGEHDGHDHSGHSHASIETNYDKPPTEEELEMWRKAGATSRYAYLKGMEGLHDEVQAELWDALRNDPTTDEVLAKKEGDGYAYVQLRKNAVRILQFAYKKSKGHMDRAYWAERNQQFDDDLWSQVGEGKIVA